MDEGGSGMYGCFKVSVVEDLLPTEFGVVKLLQMEHRHDLIAREYFNPDQGIMLFDYLHSSASRMHADCRLIRRSVRSVFWYSETDVLPTHLSHLLCLAVLPAGFGSR